MHLVVRGHITDFRAGDIQTFSGTFGSYPTIFGVVAIDEVLKGLPMTKTEGTIDVAELGWRGLVLSDLPTEPVLMFLMNYAELREDEGVSPSDDPDDRYYYGLPNGYQGALRSLDGRVDIVQGPEGWEDALGPCPSGLDGRSFDEVVDRVREIVASSST